MLKNIVQLLFLGLIRGDDSYKDIYETKWESGYSGWFHDNNKEKFKKINKYSFLVHINENTSKTLIVWQLIPSSNLHPNREGKRKVLENHHQMATCCV